MHEGLQLKAARHGSGKLGDVLDAHLTRKHHARRTQVVPGGGRGGVRHRSLRAHVARHMRRIASGQGKRPQITQDERVGAGIVDSLEVRGQLGEVLLAHERVHRHVNRHARRMGTRDRFVKRFEREIVRALTHAEAIGGKVDRVGAEADGGVELAGAAGGSEQLARGKIGHAGRFLS